MRALTHIHSTYSWDCRSGVSRLADALVANNIDLALVCDHDDFAGSLALRELVASRGLDLQVPVAAEIRTDHGDVVVVFEQDDPPAVADLKRWEDLTGIVRDRGGLIWLPHPYQSHTEVEILAAVADVIEVFNARCSVEQNRLAAELCDRHGATPGFGADIHRITEIGRFCVSYPPAASMLATLRLEPSCPEPVSTRRSDVMAAEIVNGWKRRRPTLIGYFTLRWCAQRVLELASVRRPPELTSR